MKLSRVLKSRESWKEIAKNRRGELVSVRQKLGRLQQKVEKLEVSVETLSGEVKSFKKAATEVQETTPKLVTKNEIRVICVLMFSFAFIPCNAIKRVLILLQQRNSIPFDWLPDPSSFVNWIARAGLGCLQTVLPLDEPWIALIDSSISYGKAKILVCLRVPVSHFLKNNCAVALEHLECVGLIIRDQWKAEDVCNALKDLFEKIGAPAAILKDQGADLKCGVGLLQATYPKIFTIKDIGHVVALLLKKTYSKNVVYLRFLKLVDVARSRLCHSDISALRPPKIRAKGRFQSVSRLVDWAERMLTLCQGAGKAKQGSVAAKLRLAIPKLFTMRFFFGRFGRDCRTANEFLCILKNNGLNQESFKRCKSILEKLSKHSTLRKGLETWLRESIATQCKLSIGQTPLLVSTDALESLFGSVKNIIERMPSPEFGTLSLVTPLLCGKKTHENISHYLNSCSQKMLKKWKVDHLSNTNRRVKHRLKQKIIVKVVQDLKSSGGT